MFERSRKNFRQIQLTSLIDILVLLVVFFMLSSTFIKTESIELSIPKVDNSTKAQADASIIRVFVSDNGDISIGNRLVDEAELQRSLRAIFKSNPAQRILILSGGKVSVQRMVSVMDEVYQSGGKNLSVADWNQVGFVPQVQ